MPVPFRPGPEWYVSFHEFDPSTDRQCIYYTQDKRRCLWRSDDNSRAIELQRLISTLPLGTGTLNLLIEYVLCCCCMSGRAKHRLRIEDRQELLSLAERWLDEIQRHATATIYHPTPSIPTSEESDDHNHDTSTPQVSSPNQASDESTPPSSPPSVGSNQSVIVVDGAPPKPVINSSPKHPTADTIVSTIQSFESQTRYNLRSGNPNASIDSISSVELALIYRAPQSEFAPHVTSPGPGDRVSQKLLECLVDDDFRTGWLYIFNRHSSPGHVKIGYTAWFVEGRLAQWSKCGYTPNLLFDVGNVPYVRRAETLAHHELIKEWRRERRCNHGRGCASAHQEWFEISLERSSTVLGDWADFMKRAEPYDAAGRLKPQWMKFAKLSDATQEMVTAKKLLEHYEASLVDDNKNLVEKLAALELMPKVEEKESAGIKSNVEDVKPAPFSGTQPSKLDAPSKSNLPPRYVPLLETDSLSRSELSAKTNAPDEASNAKRILVQEDMPPEQIPLPPSPLLQPTAYADDESSVEEIGETSSTTIKENGLEPDPDKSHVVACLEPKIEIPVLTSAPTDIIAQARSPSVTQLSEALVNLRVHDKETGKTASSPSRCQQKAAEQPQADADTEFYNVDDTIVADEEDNSWDDDLTLVAGDQTEPLELAPLKIINGLYNGIPNGKSSGTSKGLDTVTVLETEAQPSVAVIA